MCLTNGKVYNRDVGIALLRAKSLLELGYVTGFEELYYDDNRPMKMNAIPSNFKKVARVILAGDVRTNHRRLKCH
eukprot:7086020-Karenia_brevis.AAC.1